jgi:hypothetical protein
VSISDILFDSLNFNFEIYKLTITFWISKHFQFKKKNRVATNIPSYRTQLLCRVSDKLHSTKRLALGKEPDYGSESDRRSCRELYFFFISLSSTEFI